jgi:hypothetical protein
MIHVKMPSRERGHFRWHTSKVNRAGSIRCFLTTLEDLIPTDHVCRVIEAFVSRLKMDEIGFVRAEPAETGRPGYDPRRVPLRGVRFHPSSVTWCWTNWTES